MKIYIIILLSLLLSQCKAQTADMVIIYFSGIPDKPILPIIICVEKIDTAFIYQEAKDSLMAKYAILETTISVDTSIITTIDRLIQKYPFNKETDSLDWGNFHVFRYSSKKRISDYLLRNASSSKKFFTLLISELKKRGDCPELLLYYLEEDLRRLR